MTEQSVIIVQYQWYISQGFGKVGLFSVVIISFVVNVEALKNLQSDPNTLLPSVNILALCTALAMYSVGKGHVTFIKHPCAHFSSLQSLLIFQYCHSCSFIYQWTLRSRSLFHFTYIASLLHLVPQVFSSALRYSCS